MMDALVKYDSRDHAVEIRQIPEPPAPGPDEVILEVKAAGVCGSDLHMWHENHSWQIKLPLVLGHEFCGVIAEHKRQMSRASKLGIVSLAKRRPRSAVNVSTASPGIITCAQIAWATARWPTARSLAT